MPRRAIVVLLLAVASLCAGCRKKPAPSHDAPAASGSLVVLASLPLEGALPAGKARVEVARSPGIARKLDADHPDVVIADSKTVERLISTGKLDAGTRRALVVDRLVIVSQPGSPIPLEKPEDLARLAADAPPWRGRLLVLDPDTWPEGELTRSTLQAMHAQGGGVWDVLGDRVQRVADAEDLARGVEAHKRMLGVLGRSSALAFAGRVHVMRDLGPAVAYQAAVVKASSRRDAALRYIADLASDAGLRAFEARGFMRSARGQ